MHAAAGDAASEREEVNELLARSEEELAVFQAMDEGSSLPGSHIKTPTQPGKPIELMTESQIPEWARKRDDKPATEPVVLGKRARRAIGSQCEVDYNEDDEFEDEFEDDFDDDPSEGRGMTQDDEAPQQAGRMPRQKHVQNGKEDPDLSDAGEGSKRAARKPKSVKASAKALQVNGSNGEGVSGQRSSRRGASAPQQARDPRLQAVDDQVEARSARSVGTRASARTRKPVY
jgi:ATP-dependent helicase STH1/SNF2